MLYIWNAKFFEQGELYAQNLWAIFMPKNISVLSFRVLAVIANIPPVQGFSERCNGDADFFIA